MALLEVHTFPDGDDTSLTLFNEEWGRALAIGDDWQRLRIGIMCAVEPDVGNNLLLTRASLGISTAANDHLGSGAAEFWVGANVAGPGADINGTTWVWNPGGGVNPFYTVTTYSRIQSLGGVITGGWNAGSAGIPTTTGAVKRRWPIMVEYEKWGTNIFCGWGALNVFEGDPAQNKDFTVNQFVEAMENPSRYLCRNSNIPIGDEEVRYLGHNAFPNFDVNEATRGALVAPHVGWNKAVLGFRVYAIAAARLEPNPVPPLP